MKPDNLIVFILSHKSPSKCETLDTLKRLHFRGKWFIIVDNEDDYLDEYKEKYKDNLIIFDKSKYLYNVDIGYSIKHMPSYSHPIFARNAVEDVAKKLKMDYYIVCDDDIYDFKFRIPIDEYKKVPVIDIEDINEVLYLYYKFMMDFNVPCIGLGTPNFYIGGYEGITNGSYLTRRCISNFYMRNLNTDVDWIMPLDDYTTSIFYGITGKLFLTLYPLEVMVRPQYTQKNKKEKLDGMSDFYRKSSDYARAFCSYMVAPSFINIKNYKGNVIPAMKKDNAYPKIISSKFKEK